VPESTGWWQTVYLDDVNGDGNMDILAGNWGWNNKFHSGKNGPVKLYVSDFDKNGQTDQLLAYTSNGNEYPFLAKDEMERALPVLRKHYLLYADYAGQVMKDVFYGFVDNMKPLIAERMGSAVLFGDGSGNFVIKDLPSEQQLSPVFCFQKINQPGTSKNQYLAGGNFFDVIPYEGRYDAQALSLFEISGKDSIHSIHQQGLEGINKQVRDIKWLKTGSGYMLTVAPNNDGLIFYHPVKN
jgi:hypothetical protein